MVDFNVFYASSVSKQRQMPLLDMWCEQTTDLTWLQFYQEEELKAKTNSNGKEKVD